MIAGSFAASAVRGRISLIVRALGYGRSTRGLSSVAVRLGELDG